MDHRIHQMPAASMPIPNKVKPNTVKPQQSFQTILQEQSKLKLSKHASERLEERKINISDTLWQTIGDKVQEAKGKGINDSLIVLNNAALLVSAKNNTVVTAMNRDEAQNRIFTNINGTILIDE